MQKCLSVQDSAEIKISGISNHPKRDGTKTWYCPYWSGYLSLMAHTQQLGINLLTPTPNPPCCHKINWR